MRFAPLTSNALEVLSRQPLTSSACSPYTRPSLQHGHRQGLQRPHRRERKTRTMGMITWPCERASFGSTGSIVILSNDLGAVGALLFDVGSGRYPAPPREGDEAERARWEADVAASGRRPRRSTSSASTCMSPRTIVETRRWWSLGRWLSRRATSRRGCRERAFGRRHLAGTRPRPRRHRLRGGAHDEYLLGDRALLDLTLGVADRAVHALLLVAPDNREADGRAQLQRPAFRGVARLHVRFLPYSELEHHREAMARFGAGLKANRGGLPARSRSPPSRATDELAASAESDDEVATVSPRRT